jgi:hypothetical protein
MDANILAGIAGVVLSLVFAYAPGVQGWFNALDGTYKRLINLGALALVAAAVFGLGCAKWFSVPVTCDQTGLEGLIQAFVAAAIANQGAYLMTTASSPARKLKYQK